MKRALLCSFLRRSGLLRLLSAGRSPRIVVLNYHRIAASADELDATLFDAETYSCTVAQLEDHIRIARQYADIVSLEELGHLIASSRRPQGHAVAITFDDGYIDNYTLAFPVLKRLAAPATFFIPTRPIEERTVGWWDQISFILKTTRRTRIRIDYPEAFEANLAALGRDQAARQVFGLIKRTEHIDYERLIEHVADAADTPPPSAAEASSQLMSWQQISQMASSGMTIGAHGHTHYIFAHMTAEEQRVDLETCKELLVNRIGSTPTFLSYPVGNRMHYTEDTKRISRDLGFELAFNFAPDARAIDPVGVDPYDLDRRAVSWPNLDLLAAQTIGLPI